MKQLSTLACSIVVTWCHSIFVYVIERQACKLGLPTPSDYARLLHAPANGNVRPKLEGLAKLAQPTNVIIWMIIAMSFETCDLSR